MVYVGRIRRSMTHQELRERFLQFGQVECVSLHFRETGCVCTGGLFGAPSCPLTLPALVLSDHYAFVTFYNVKDAFAAIDNGSRLRRPDEKPLDLCFGGRRLFCSSRYTDLGKNLQTPLGHPESWRLPGRLEPAGTFWNLLPAPFTLVQLPDAAEGHQPPQA